MAKGELILICHFGGHFMTNEDGTLTYNYGEAYAVDVTSETSFSDLKLSLAETCDLKQETVTVKYFLPGNKRDLITAKNDKDVKRMIDSHGDALTAQVFVSGTPDFVYGVPEPQANRQSDTKMERLERETSARVKLINSQKVAEDLKVLAINTSGLAWIDATIINEQKARIRTLYQPRR